MLQALGLSEVSEQVYRALLDDPTLEDAALAGRLGLSQVQIGICLHELSEMTLLRKSREDPGKRYPVSLQRGIAVLVQRQEQELEARRQALLEGQAAAALLAESVARERFQVPGGVEQVTALDDIHNLLESLVQAARYEVCSMVPTVMPQTSLEFSRPGDEDLARRGVKTKSICLDGIRSNAAALEYEKFMVSLGAQVRTAAVVPLRILIVDRVSAVLPFDPETMSEGAVVTTAPGMVIALRELFDRAWEEATPLETEPVSDEVAGLTDAEAELLRILSGGLTDEAAAKRLGVSARTVKRRMEDLMRRLEAGSRFEAGYRAAKRGWL